MKRLMSKDLADRSKYLRLLVYGNPGTGKTWFGASAALDEATAPVLYIHYRGQVSSLQSNPEYMAALEAGRLCILELEAYKELNHVYTWLNRGPGSMPALDKVFPTFPKTVVVDSISELQRLEVMRRGGNQDGEFLVDIDRPSIRDWGQLLDQFILLAKLMYALPMHVVFTGLEAVTRDQAEQVESIGLAMAGQAQRLFPAYALTVMRLERVARNLTGYNVGKTQTVKACVKDQTGCIPSSITGPTIPKLVRLLMKGGDA